jgi:hypothetical protein
VIVHSVPAKAYWSKKGNLSETTLAHVDWESRLLAAKTIP